MSYPLPHHTSLTSLDPLDVCGDIVSNIEDDASVSHHAIIETLLSAADRDLDKVTLDRTDSASVRKWSTRFGELLQDIAYSLHGVGDLDTGFLEERLTFHESSTLRAFHGHLFKSVRLLKSLYPTAFLRTLDPINTELDFTPVEIDALLAHLILGTVQIPEENDWGRPGFTALYRSSPSVPSTVTGYLDTLINLFATGGYEMTLPPTFRFTWSHSMTSCQILPGTLAMSEVPTARVVPLVKPIASEPTINASSSTFILLSAHSQPGPGPAGTHEERLTGQSPALAITSLICPRLESTVALVTTPFPVHASWEGHNRYARLTKLYNTDERLFRRYIIADAAELDVQEHGDILPDLKPGIVEREIGKLEAGFSGCARVVATDTSSRIGESGRLDDWRIEVVPWGCQAFGGNLVTKAQCMMMAGGLAGVDSINLIVTEDRKDEASKIETLSNKRMTIGDLYRQLKQC